MIVAPFYAGRERFADYLPFILAGRRALAATNPSARYVVLTNRATAPLIEPHAEVAVLLSGARPLVLDGLHAQASFVAGADADLIVLPDLDCIANRDLRDVTPASVGFAMTHKGRKFFYNINNCGYVRDRDLGGWFLRRAAVILESWPAEEWAWTGDQKAWGAVVGLPVDDPDILPHAMRRSEDDILDIEADGRTVRVYPNATHNCVMSNDGAIRPAQDAAWMVHFKGPRKGYLDRFMRERFGNAD